MDKETKTAVYDEELRLEAYRFAGLVRPFPGRFHEYYCRDFDREEALLSLASLLFGKYGRARDNGRPHLCRDETERTCAFIEGHYAERISLDIICRNAGLSKSALLRAFTMEKGVTPYRYLENIRVREAKKLLERGVPTVDAAPKNWSTS